MLKMAEASTEVPEEFKSSADSRDGSHSGYIFQSNSEKQQKLFELCREQIMKQCGILYIAGKQGVKGIRLSFIDTGFDVAGYQRNGQMNIVDSEEWYLSGPRRNQFKPFEELEKDFRKVSEGTVVSGYTRLLVISETDMLIRKGFLQEYAKFDEQLGRSINDLRITFVCAFDERELAASGVKDPILHVSDLHEIMI